MEGTGRRWGGVLALVAVLAVAGVGLVAFRRDPPPPDRPEPATAARVGVHPGTWSALPDPPLPPRWGSVGGWTGREVLVVGGSEGVPCLLRCDASAVRRDGEAYDPAGETWRSLPPAPVPVGPGSIAATAGADLVVTTGTRWLVLQTERNRWLDLPAPGFRATALTGSDDLVYAVAGPRVAVLDLTRFRWTHLPVPPQPQARQPVPTAYDGGLAVASLGRVVDRWDGERWDRSYVRSPGYVDPGDGTWRRLPAPPGPAGTSWLGLPETDGRPPTSGNGHVWDPGDEVWVGLGSPTRPPRSYATVVYAERRIYVVGGLGVNRSGTEATDLADAAWVWSP